jgi:tripartite-type tricarboxylate transporter receptor subunit TctC
MLRQTDKKTGGNIMIRTCRGALALFASTLLGLVGPALADTFPSKPVTIILPYAPGGGPDLLTRVFAEKMSDHLGQRVIVDNRVGAGGMLAAQVAANAAPDGYTLLLGASNHITQKLIQPGVKWDPVKDFVHIVRLGTSPTVMVVEADAPYQSAKDLVAAAKAKPGSLNYASGGIGSAEIGRASCRERVS